MTDFDLVMRSVDNHGIPLAARLHMQNLFIKQATAYKEAGLGSLFKTTATAGKNFLGSLIGRVPPAAVKSPTSLPGMTGMFGRSTPAITAAPAASAAPHAARGVGGYVGNIGRTTFSGLKNIAKDTPWKGLGVTGAVGAVPAAIGGSYLVGDNPLAGKDTLGRAQWHQDQLKNLRTKFLADRAAALQRGDIQAASNLSKSWQAGTYGERPNFLQRNLLPGMYRGQLNSGGHQQAFGGYRDKAIDEFSALRSGGQSSVTMLDEMLNEPDLPSEQLAQLQAERARLVGEGTLAGASPETRRMMDRMYRAGITPDDPLFKEYMTQLRTPVGGGAMPAAVAIGAQTAATKTPGTPAYGPVTPVANIQAQARNALGINSTTLTPSTGAPVQPSVMPPAANSNSGSR